MKVKKGAMKVNRSVGFVGSMLATAGATTALASPVSATPTDSVEPGCSEADVVADENLLEVQADGTEVYGLACVTAVPTKNLAAADSCWITEAWKVWEAPLGTHDLQRMETTTRWCDDGTRAGVPEFQRVYGNGYWGWSYDGTVERNAWKQGNHSYSEVAGKFNHVDTGTEIRWLKVEYTAGGTAEVV